MKWSFSKDTIIFCLILDLAIIAAMVLIAYFTKTAWSLVLLFVLQKPDHKDSGNVDQNNPPRQKGVNHANYQL